ncbi:aldose 1-epimerase [Aegicerativicinus sediminis]|uniref:aldose 1-epimerase n=1 Tax=Aegicerativicinus sediminis TaxID=2893202 RepID=UPI001E2A2D58|nr:aldose 1-epimerase [Aegicerativicinus sediminis]
MYRILKSKDGEDMYAEILNSDKSSYSKIYLNKGASLQELVLGNNHIIKNMSPMTYEETYASSILFPFANRVKDGKYRFENKTYQLEINETDLNNALHGLVYNKTFEIINEEVTDTSATVKLAYHETKKLNGFPYSYSVYLDYTLKDFDLEIKVSVKNTDTKTFPFTLGWHPYFVSDNLGESLLMFDSNKKLKWDNRNITTGILETEVPKVLKIQNQEFNDCFLLNSSVVHFQTPKYLLILMSSESDGFLQLYTPPKKNTIAIEPTTGVSDSLNNKIGLKTLKPNNDYEVEWNVTVVNN